MDKRILRVIRAGLITLFLLLSYYVFVRVTGFFIPCPIRKVTGFLCPGCGVSHMCISLMHLDFSAAFAYNPAVLLSLPFIAAVLGSYIYMYIRYGTGKLPGWSSVLSVALAVVLIIFGILRNL